MIETVEIVIEVMIFLKVEFFNEKSCYKINFFKKLITDRDYDRDRDRGGYYRRESRDDRGGGGGRDDRGGDRYDHDRGGGRDDHDRTHDHEQKKIEEDGKSTKEVAITEENKVATEEFLSSFSFGEPKPPGEDGDVVPF